MRTLYFSFRGGVLPSLSQGNEKMIKPNKLRLSAIDRLKKEGFNLADNISYRDLASIINQATGWGDNLAKGKKSTYNSIISRFCFENPNLNFGLSAVRKRTLTIGEAVKIIREKNPSLAANLAKCEFKRSKRGALLVVTPADGFTIAMLGREKNKLILKDVIGDYLLIAGKNKSDRPGAKIVKIKNNKLVQSNAFLSSPEWRRARYDALKKNNGCCELCGRSKMDGIKLNVDHIKPRKTHPKLALDIDNLQVLCNECNHGKGNRDDTDWRGDSFVRDYKLTVY